MSLPSHRLPSAECSYNSTTGDFAWLLYLCDGSRERCPQETHSHLQIHVPGSPPLQHALHMQAHLCQRTPLFCDQPWGSSGFHQPVVPVQTRSFSPTAFTNFDRQCELAQCMENNGQKERRSHSTENLSVVWLQIVGMAEVDSFNSCSSSDSEITEAVKNCH